MILPCPHCGQKNRVGAAHLTRAARCGACKAMIAPVATPLDVDEPTFNEVLGALREPILVDFWASWCGPCRMAAPDVARTASDVAGRAVVLKVDTERYPELASRYRVASIPNFVVIKRGAVIHQQAGVAPHAEMRRWIDVAEAEAG